MEKYLEYLINFFDLKWLNKQWSDFISSRKKYPEETVDSVTCQLSFNLHPLLRDIYSVQNRDSKKIDFSKITYTNSPQLYYLGRDLNLLKEEITKTGKKFQDLKDRQKYYSSRFELSIAAAYKFLGFDIEFASKNTNLPDIHATKDQYEFYIECKRKNTENTEIEKSFKDFFCLLSGSLFVTLKNFKFNNTLINISGVKPELPNSTEKIIQKIKEIIVSGELLSKISVMNMTISFVSILDNPNIYNFLISNGHFNKQSMITNAWDGILGSDCQTKNVIFLEKPILKNVPKSFIDYLEDADKKETSGKKYIVYVDTGESVEEHAEQLAKNLTRTIYDYKKICMIVLCKMTPDINNGKIIFRPRIKIIASKKRMGGKEINNLPIFGMGKSVKDYIKIKSCPGEGQGQRVRAGIT